MLHSIRTVPALVALVLTSAASVYAQRPDPKPSDLVQKLGPGLFRIGEVRVDTTRREISVSGKVNTSVMVLEFVANTRSGYKAYESAVTVDADAITFNTALLLIGLDKAHARVPTRHFDPVAPQGDRVGIWLDWDQGPTHRHIEIEQLLLDKRTGQPIPPGGWVYTGSTLLTDGRYMAELDGVLIGFVHSPSPIIESAVGAGVGRYGTIVLNPNIGLAPGTMVTLTLKALDSNGARP